MAHLRGGLGKEKYKMPTYEYECQKCKKTFEISQSMKDKPLTACLDKKCKGKVRRLIGSGGGFIFKGPGFYTTDNRSPTSPCHACKEECKH